MGEPEWVVLAVLGKPRGNRGELTSVALSSRPDLFPLLSRVFLALPDSPVAGERVVQDVWFHGGVPVWKFAGIDSITDAEAWQGCEVRIPFSERRTPEPGEYFHSDLEGCEVWNGKSGERLGRVTGILESGTDLLEVDGGQYLVPFTPAICTTIDVIGKRIVIDPPDGLLELNRP